MANNKMLQDREFFVRIKLQLLKEKKNIRRKIKFLLN